MRAEQGHEPLPIERLRPFASAGARGLVHAGLRREARTTRSTTALRETFLEYYAERVCERDRGSSPASPSCSASSAARDIAWGIVTNKATRFTERVVAALKLDARLRGRAATRRRTSSRIRLRCCTRPSSFRCRRPIAATWATTCATSRPRSAAGMRPIAVDWGYHHPESGGPDTWQAEAIIAPPPGAASRHL